MPLVTIRSYATSPEAHVDAELLRSQGVAASVQDENAVTADLLLPAIGYIKLTVPPDQVARAEELLAEARQAGGPDEDPPDWTCPACGNHQATVYHPFLWAILLPILFPLVFIRRAYCTRCQRTFAMRDYRAALRRG